MVSELTLQRLPMLMSSTRPAESEAKHRVGLVVDFPDRDGAGPRTGSCRHVNVFDVGIVKAPRRHNASGFLDSSPRDNNSIQHHQRDAQRNDHGQGERPKALRTLVAKQVHRQRGQGS